MPTYHLGAPTSADLEVRIMGDSRENERRINEEVNRQGRRQKLLYEAESSARQNAAVAMKWSALFDKECLPTTVCLRLLGVAAAPLFIVSHVVLYIALFIFSIISRALLIPPQLQDADNDSPLLDQKTKEGLLLFYDEDRATYEPYVDWDKCKDADDGHESEYPAYPPSSDESESENDSLDNRFYRKLCGR